MTANPRRSAIRLEWAPTRYHAVVLCALWLFYRVLNALGFRRTRDDEAQADTLAEVEQYIVQFDATRPPTKPFEVTNIQSEDGRTWTVFIAQVSGPGPIYPDGPHV
jgi:hypothetical protein